MKITAAVLREQGQPLLIESIELDSPGAGEVLVELKAAGVDMAARFALQRGMDVVFCDNRVVTMGGDGTFEDLVLQTATLAEERFARAPKVRE